MLWAMRVLVIVDTPEWAQDRKTDALAKWLGSDYEIRKRYQDEVTSRDLFDADCALVYYWLQIDRLGHLRSAFRKISDRLLIGVCSGYELSGNWERPAMAMLSSLPRAVFVNNRILFDALQPRLAKPVHYTPNGVDTGFFRPAPPEPDVGRPLRVGWAGSLANQGFDHRGVHEFIAPAVKAIGGCLKLAIREEKWRTLDEMRDFYHSIDVYVCASRSEGTPNPALEASASGLPVITTRVGNMPELIRDGENGFLVERNVESIAQKLRLLRDDFGLRRRLGQAAREAVEAWDWRHQVRHFDAMFRDVLARPAVRPASFLDRVRTRLTR